MLYVDDDENLLAIVKLFFEEKNTIMVDTAISAEDARNRLTTHKYDAIVSDCKIPHINGIGFLKYVRKKQGDIPFILFTGKGREEVVIQAIHKGGCSLRGLNTTLSPASAGFLREWISFTQAGNGLKRTWQGTML